MTPVLKKITDWHRQNNTLSFNTVRKRCLPAQSRKEEESPLDLLVTMMAQKSNCDGHLTFAIFFSTNLCLTRGYFKATQHILRKQSSGMKIEMY